MRRIRKIDSELHLLGRSLFAALVGFFFAINTVSNITVIPIIYWILCGLGVGYVFLVKQVVVLQRMSVSQHVVVSGRL